MVNDEVEFVSISGPFASQVGRNLHTVLKVLLSLAADVGLESRWIGCKSAYSS